MKGREGLKLKDMVDRIFNASEASRLSGISYGKILYWVSTGLVSPSWERKRKKGVRIFLNFPELVELCLIERLREEGISLPRIRKAVNYLRKKSKNGRFADQLLFREGEDIICQDGKAGREGKVFSLLQEKGQLYLEKLLKPPQKA